MCLQLNHRNHSKLLELDNVIITPHIGASTNQAQKRVGVEIAKNITKFLNGNKTNFIVNKKSLNLG